MRALGVDVGGTAIKTVLVDAGGSTLASSSVATPRDPEQLVATIARIAAEQDADLPIGVCVPGIVDEAAGIGVLSANLGWRDLPLRSMISAAVGREIGFGHDVRCGARAEARWGRAADRLLYLALGTGLAAVTVVDGAPLPGHWAGELGQPLVVDPFDGQLASVEQICGAAAMVRRHRARNPGADPSDSAGVRSVFAAAASGDAAAQQVITEALDLLAEVSTICIALVAPDRVVLAGGPFEAEAAFFAPLVARIDARLGLLPGPVIGRSEFGSLAQAMGAAALVLPARGI